MPQLVLYFTVIFIFITKETICETDCICVPYYMCDPIKNVVVPDESAGVGIINPRSLNQCFDSIEVCCKLPMNESAKQNDPEDQECGVWKGDVDCDDFHCDERFPWDVTILTLSNRKVIASGSLIHPRVVVTTANAISSVSAHRVKIRAGEWNTFSEKRGKPFKERTALNFLIHPQYDHRNLQNDVALIILSAPLELGENIKTICLPDHENDEDSSEHRKDCITPWKNDSSSSNEKKVKMYTIPIQPCNGIFRKTNFGTDYYELASSLFCAESTKGFVNRGMKGASFACPVDGKKNIFQLTGIQSSNSRNVKFVPATYVKLAKFKNWIDAHLKKLI